MTRGGPRPGAGQPPKYGAPMTIRKEIKLTEGDYAEITAAVPGDEPWSRWVVEAALMRARGDVRGPSRGYRGGAMKISRKFGLHNFEMQIKRNSSAPLPGSREVREESLAWQIVTFSIDGIPVEREDFDLALRICSVV